MANPTSSLLPLLLFSLLLLIQPSAPELVSPPTNATQPNNAGGSSPPPAPSRAGKASLTASKGCINITVGNLSVGLGSGCQQAPAPPPSAWGLVSPTGGKGSYKNMVREFVREHNKVRATEGEAPLVWDRAIARYAKLWSEQRREDCAFKHSGGRYGENMFWGAGWHWKAKDAVDVWAREREHYNRTTNECTPGNECGHFTQIVWNSTVRFGCARVECFAGGVIITCDYEPAGNWNGEGPFHCV